MPLTVKFLSSDVLSLSHYTVKSVSKAGSFIWVLSNDKTAWVGISKQINAAVVAGRFSNEFERSIIQQFVSGHIMWLTYDKM